MTLNVIGMKPNNLPLYNQPPLDISVFWCAGQYLFMGCCKMDIFTHQLYTSRLPRWSGTGALGPGNLLVTLRWTHVNRERRWRWARRRNKDLWMLERSTSECQHPNWMFLKWPKWNSAKQSQHTFLTRALWGCSFLPDAINTSHPYSKELRKT